MIKPINISIYYDQLLVAEGYKAVLSGHKQFHISNLIENDVDILKKIKYNETDLLIIEFSDITKENITYINHLHKSLPSQKLLIISGSITHKFINPLIKIIDGYLLRTCSSEKLILAIHEIFEGRKYLCSQLIPILLEDNHENGFKIDLTSREREVLSLLYTTKHNSDIAEKLNISQTTVRTHLKNIRQKCGNKNEVQLMRYACNKNLLKDNCIPLCPNCRFFLQKKWALI
ncbi:DNA-binding response regulator [Ancylomarina euxinus]|uniref:DNA-binding response regulator n=1 Tax=Ancylomarina euxinus TaxID=2283627 RepID=A0A425XXV2_9BACT|nr:response regulator transcription factor [Ancylomarina euxinus]MCZ4696052.1 response regulator transcription factor [Ancylomarina euxinus]MUP13991.1 ArsR family transcriptional regulator [Ancylomarina euxinus]RRG19545.1 DNA-binding response regulator [Ancylomarina euxinus]